MSVNKEATRYFSDRHEKSVCDIVNGIQQPNSGAGRFKKGDVINAQASLLVECKTVETEKKSISIKKDWIDKNKKECFENRLDNSCVAFNFEPNGESYFVIDSKLMKFLVEKLEEFEN